MKLKILSLSLITCISIASAAPDIKLNPVIESFVPENRIVLSADITSDSQIQVVRTYFKSSDSVDYVFMPMTCSDALSCSTTIPAPSKGTTSIDYLVLVVDAEKKVYKTQTFTAIANDDDSLPAYQTASKEGTLHVKTGLAKAPQTISGFTDSFTIDTIESVTRFGVVAGLYNSSKSGGTAAATAGATTGGTVAASAVGLSTTSLLIGGAVAVGAGVAIAGGGGGGGDHDDHHNDYTPPANVPEEIVGIWYFDGKCVKGTANVFNSIQIRIPNNTGHFAGTGTGSDSSGTFNIIIDGNYDNQSALANYYVDITDTVDGYLGRDTVSNARISVIGGHYDTGFIPTTTTRSGCPLEARFYQK